MKKTDDTDLFRPDDETGLSGDDLADRLTGLEYTEEGWLANASVAYQTRRSR